MTTTPTTTPAGWYPTQAGLRYWDGTAWLAPTPVLAVPARTAHGLLYWLTIGLFWSPLKWSVRVLLWLALWPLGLWRSMASSRAKQDARLRRGAR